MAQQSGFSWSDPQNAAWLNRFEQSKKMKQFLGGGGNQATDPYQLPQKPQFSASNQGPYQMPGGPAQISTNGQAGPRPQQPPGQRADINVPNFAPGQQPYTGPKIVPMNNQPGKGIGPGGPNRFVPGFQPNRFLGANRGTIQNPYQMPQNTSWGY